MCQNPLKVTRLTEKFNELRYSGPSLVLLGSISTNSAANTTETHFYKTREKFLLLGMITTKFDQHRFSDIWVQNLIFLNTIL